MHVCAQCFGESPALRERFEEAGSPGDCPTCGATGVRVLDAASLSDLFQGFETYYEPLCGDPYTLGKEGISGIGPDTGDESLVTVLREDWEVFSDRISDEQAEDILASVWPGYSGEYMVRPSERWREVREEVEEFKRRLGAASEGDADGQGALRELLDPWVESLGSSLPRSSWVRARVQENRGTPFAVSEMGAPPPENATAGRANPQGIPFLYVSSDEATAIAEVRAEPGDWVTVAQVEVPARGTLVLDLIREVRVIDPFGHTDLDEALMVREFLHQFGDELSRPIRRKDAEAEYVPTQSIAMYFRSNGYAGVVFPSSVSSGMNAVFFDATGAAISAPVERAVWSKSLDVVDSREFDRRERQRRGLPF